MAVTLTQPGINSTGWGGAVNTNFQTIQNSLNNGACKAWVKFDGTAANVSATLTGFNVTSITDNAAGNYTVNLTTPFTNANYCAVASANGLSGSFASDINGVPTASSFGICIVWPGNTFGDAATYVSAACFGAN